MAGTGRVFAVEGSYDDVNRLCAELASEQPTWAFVNVNVRTYYAEGSKTLAFEVAEQLGWQTPDHVVARVTGDGLKTVEALSGTVGPTATIAPTLDAFAAAMGAEYELTDEPAPRSA